jgi:hypothetical protein
MLLHSIAQELDDGRLSNQVAFEEGAIEIE